MWTRKNTLGSLSRSLRTRTSHLQFQVHMLTICFKRVQNPHFLGIFRGGAGSVQEYYLGRVLYTVVLEIDRAFRVRFSKSTRRDRCRVCAKFESSRQFRGSNMNHKKSLVDADASPSIHASIHRSLVSPTALAKTEYCERCTGKLSG
jgi:hypothetical protein